VLISKDIKLTIATATDSGNASPIIAKDEVRKDVVPRASRIRTAKEKPMNIPAPFIWSNTLTQRG